MPKKSKPSLSYLITISKAHLLPAQMLIVTLRAKTKAKIVAVGNLEPREAQMIKALDVTYLDEDSIDMSGRLPKVEWTEKYRAFGWYKQMFIRLCIDRFMETDQVVILDSEVFVFDNWDEARFYDPQTGNPRLFCWTPSTRKPDWDYKMYRGAAYLLSFLPEGKGVMKYADSTNYKRHISGVVLFSTKNVSELWRRLETNTDLSKNINDLFNNRPELAFSDHDIYGIAAEYGLFDNVVPTTLCDDLQGWYENQIDPKTEVFKPQAMWSMCQTYANYQQPNEYRGYMERIAKVLNKGLPRVQYWNKPDRGLIDEQFDSETGFGYFQKYKRQLDLTFRTRYSTISKALELLSRVPDNKIIVEIGTLRDNTKGGGHSTYKFGEFCSRFGGVVHTIDILPEAIDFSMKATADYQPWIRYHVSDPSQFLAGFDSKIDLLYLDGPDSTEDQEDIVSRKQLNEIAQALPKLAHQAIVLLDDAALPHGRKTHYSANYLAKHGFNLVIDSYQKLYVRGFGQPTKAKNVLVSKLRRLVLGS